MRENDNSWSPYLGGALTGVLATASVVFAGKYLGASTTFARSAGLIEKTIAPEHVAALDYFVKYTPKIDWQWMFVVGIMLGSFVSAITSNSFLLTGTPDMWAKHHGKSPAKRAIYAFIGGAVALFGARLAGGCPSGHGLSGFMQLSISGFIAIACFFIGGLISANLIYRGRRS